MGEIGIQRLEYLYDLTFCDLLLIERGYARRHRNLWSATRWQAYNLMMAFVGNDAMKKSGIMSPKDLISFPWDFEPVIMSEEEKQELMDEMRSYNNLNL